MILACHNLSKSFGDQVIVKDGSFHIENHEKAALVGLNGAGKSTILKMIVGQLSPDAGTVVLTKGKTLGYLAQHQEMESGNTIYEEVRTAKAEVIEMEKQIRTIEIELPSLSGDALEARLATYQRLTSAFEHADGYAYKSELTGVLKGLGFTEEEFTAKEVITAAVKIARQAVDECGHGYVAMDIGPSGKLMKPLGDLSFDHAYELFSEMAICGRDAGADAVFELPTAVATAVGSSKLPYWLQKKIPIYLSLSP